MVQVSYPLTGTPKEVLVLELSEPLVVGKTSHGFIIASFPKKLDPSNESSVSLEALQERVWTLEVSRPIML